ncbi:MAG TPA: COQ9 family protein [Rhizomicrobium sp.]|jgi:ubiquinone biosynthesis protein COQ9|nr:COQ9 family protein [Rhizomicrobium sp.]
MAPRKKSTDDAALKTAVLDAALKHVVFDGFTDRLLVRAGEEVGADRSALARLFPDGPQSLVEAFSEAADAEMEKHLAAMDLGAMKIRSRIAAAVMARIEAVRPHKEAARRAAAFLTLPPHAPLGTRLVWRTVDAMWRAAGDTATDFNFYSKRGILAGVYTATLMRWFTDQSAGEAETAAFLAARIENVMQFEKFKAQAKQAFDRLPPLSDVLAAFARR